MATIPPNDLQRCSTHITQFSKRDVTDTVFNRLHTSKNHKAGAILAHSDNAGNLICEQFAIDESNKTFRPLVPYSRQGNHSIFHEKNGNNNVTDVSIRPPGMSSPPQQPDIENIKIHEKNSGNDRKEKVELASSTSTPAIPTKESLALLLEQTDLLEQQEKTQAATDYIHQPTKRTLRFSAEDMREFPPESPKLNPIAIPSMLSLLPFAPTVSLVAPPLPVVSLAAPHSPRDPHKLLNAFSPAHRTNLASLDNRPVPVMPVAAPSKIKTTCTLSTPEIRHSLISPISEMSTPGSVMMSHSSPHSRTTIIAPGTLLSPASKKRTQLLPVITESTAGISSTDNLDKSLYTPSKRHKKLLEDIAFKTPGGTEMTTARHINVELTDEFGNPTQASLLLFSPDTRTADPHKKSTKKKKVKRAEANTTKDLPTPTAVIGGEPVKLKLYSRDRKNKKLYPSQITVAGKNAAKAFEEALEAKLKHHTENTQSIIKSLCSTFKLEWLHCLAFSLCPKNFNPQTMSNLGCGGSWINSTMMILEKVALYFATVHPGCVTVKPLFKMIPDTHIIDELEYEVVIQKDVVIKEGEIPHLQKVTITNRMKALALPDRSNWASVTDSALIRETVNAKLNSQPPIYRTCIKF